MAYTWEDYYRDSAKEALKHLTVEERLEGLTPEELLKVLSSEEFLEKVDADELEAVLKKLRQKQKTQQNN